MYSAQHTYQPAFDRRTRPHRQMRKSKTSRRWVSPFGNVRIKGCSHLPGPYRSVPRPSSPPSAKASVRSPYALDRSRPGPCAGNTPRPKSLKTTSQSSFQTKPILKSAGDAGSTLPSQCHPATRAERRKVAETCFLARVCDRSGPAQPRARPKSQKGGAGGAGRSRTDDLMLAKHALYQLSYGPRLLIGEAATPAANGGPRRTRTADLTLIRRVL